MESEQWSTLETLYRKLHNNMVNYANLQLVDYKLAEELTQDVFLKAYDKINKVLESPNPEGWLFITLQNLIKHEFRKRQRAVKIISLDEPSYSDDYPESEPKESMAAAGLSSEDEAFSHLNVEELQKLFSPENWYLMKRVYIEGASLSTVANELNIAYDTCRKRLTHAKEKARIELEKNEK